MCIRDRYSSAAGSVYGTGRSGFQNCLDAARSSAGKPHGTLDCWDSCGKQKKNGSLHHPANHGNNRHFLLKNTILHPCAAPAPHPAALPDVYKRQTWYEKERMRQFFSQLAQLFRIGCANHCTNMAVAISTDRISAPVFTHLAHDFIDRFAVNHPVLQFTGRWI